MSTHNKLDKICVVIVAASLLLTVLFMNGETLGITKIVDEDTELNSDSEYFTASDQDGSWDTSSATVITLSGDDASISGNGAYVNDGNVVIKNGGSYVISGELTDGSITVDAYRSSKVWILLDGVTVNCSDDACIRVDQADKVFLTLADGSQNILTSGSVYSDTALADGTDGAIYSRDDLTINGSGSLAVTAEYRHGIAANDDLVITGGVITVTAPADAIHANDSIRIKDASITVEAGDDGIVTSNEVENGYIYIESGTFRITAADDGIHATGDITTAGGGITMTAGDDGIHSDKSVLIKDGTLLIEDCCEGIEALIIDVSGGDITIYPEDDGFNANGGSGDMFGMGGMGGMGGHGGGRMDMNSQTDGEMPTPPEMSSSDGGTQSAADAADEETYISISGGTITIINENGQDADGLDSNGDIRISGGTIYVSLIGTGSNSAMDYASESGSVAEITGGTIIACGASSMAEAFDSTSTQASVLYNLSSAAEAGSTLAIEDSDGNVLLSWEVPCSFTSALVSCPQMQVGESYQVVIGNDAEEITIEEVSASYGDAQSSMFGGKMNWGGMKSRGGFEKDPAMAGDTADASTESAQGTPPEMPAMQEDGQHGDQELQQ